jgi:hypothetical protein
MSFEFAWGKSKVLISGLFPLIQRLHFSLRALPAALWNKRDV